MGFLGKFLKGAATVAGTVVGGPAGGYVANKLVGGVEDHYNKDTQEFHADPNEGQAQPDPYAGTSYGAGNYGKPGVAVDQRDFMYGRDPNAANAASALALQTGADAQSHGYAVEGLDRGIAQQVQNRTAPQGDWASQNGALAGANSYGDQLAGLETTQGPSGAQAQLQAGTNQAMNSQIALARSGRGFGGSGGATGAAQSQLAQLGAAGANNSAMLSAQENAAWRGREANNLGNAGALQAQIGQQYGAQGQADLSAKLTGQGQNDAAALGWAGQGADAQNAGVTANFTGQGLSSNVRGMEMTGGAGLENEALQRWAGKNNVQLQNQAADNQKQAAWLNAGATVLGSAIQASDIRGKTNIVPDRHGDAGEQFARGGGDYSHGAGVDLIRDPWTGEPASKDSFGRGLAFDGALYRPGGGGGHEVGTPYTPAQPAEAPMTPMQAKYLGNSDGGGEGQSGAPAAVAPARPFAHGAQPDTSKPFDTDTLDASSLDAVRNSPASFYDYKDPSAPGADDQRHYGPMAQDLAKTPAGASAVKQMPDGSLGVDTGRLALVHNGAISAQQKQLDAIQAQLDQFAKKPTAVQPGAVYGSR